MSHPAERSVRCPRCGYDQRGNIATWREWCPLNSTCTECGIEYSCAEVLCPEKFEPKWCVEYCEARPLRFARACLSTFMRSFLPWRFWARIKMSDRIHPLRIAIYVTLLLSFLLLPYVAAQTTIALYGRSFVQAELAAWAARDAYILSYAPGTIALTPVELQQYQAWYGEHWEAYVERHIRGLESERAFAEIRRENPPEIRGSAFLAAVEAIFLPTSRTTRIEVINPPEWTRYPAPVDLLALWEYLVDDAAIRLGFGPPMGAWGWMGGWIEAARLAALGFAAGVALTLMFPLTLALLPVSRKRAKVRWAHIARITAYGMYIPSTAVACMYLLLVLLYTLAMLNIISSLVDAALFIVAIGAIPFGTMLWWCFAINRHLKMPHALAVTATLMFISFLILLAAVYHLAADWMFGNQPW